MAASAARRGMFILFEGVDRSGKTTQCTRLVEHLKASDVPVEFMRFPGALTFTRLSHTARCPCHCSVSYDPSDPSTPIHPCTRPTTPPGAHSRPGPMEMQRPIALALRAHTHLARPLHHALKYYFELSLINVYPHALLRPTPARRRRRRDVIGSEFIAAPRLRSWA